MKMPSSELKYCHFIPGLDFRLSANTVERRDREGHVEKQETIKGKRKRETGTRKIKDGKTKWERQEGRKEGKTYE